MSCWWVYIVPKDESFSVGITTDPPSRMAHYGRPATCYLRGPMIQQEAIELQLSYNGMTIREKREMVFGLARRN